MGCMLFCAFVASLVMAKPSQRQGESHDEVIETKLNQRQGKSHDEVTKAKLDGYRADTDISRVVAAETHSCNERLVASASTRQYESATLPARQMGQLVCDALFSEKQQRQSRYDGGLEEDGVTQRHKSDQMRNRFIDIAQVLIQTYR